ncbi:MAG: tyrosine recombinase XerC [Gracilibacteraceae bacterium]|jgi:integrase/recombinase XerD|nr:tyrosine recombinase XerC [Gracilibacteraceae bacterium]
MATKLPEIAVEFLEYMETIRGKSKNTIKAYSYDLTLFFRFIKIKRGFVVMDMDFDEIPVDDIDVYIISNISLADLYSFLSFTANQRDNKNYARARKVACLRSFFKYLHKMKVIRHNPSIELESPKINSRHPVYLTLEESKQLLSSIDGENKERDYAIITLFLNCGLRLSELISIDINKINNDKLTVIGKGNKERTVYLNSACIDAINNYLKVRPTDDNVKDKNALFLSERKRRISKRAVQYLVKKYIGISNLDTEKYSPHKLRHTAATLMYKYGKVDIRSLQQILGHENISTTQIYTHLDDETLRNAINANPLSEEKK